MSELRDQLTRWRTAGLIDLDTSEKIAQFEARREAAEEQATDERPGLLEAVAYLGVAVVGVGVFVLLANAWDGIAEAVRPFIPAVAAVLAIVAGVFMRQSSEGGIRRGGTSAWAGSVALAATAAALWADQANASDTAVPLAAGVTAMTLAVILWFAWHSTMQVLALALGGVVLTMATANATAAWDEDYAAAGGGFLMLGMGIIAILAAESGILVPKLPGRGIAALATGVGAYMTSVQLGAFEPLPLIAGAGLIWLSIRTGYFGYTFVGVAVIFLGLFTSVVKHVSDPTLAALMLIIIGLGLLASVVLISRRRPWQASGL